MRCGMISSARRRSSGGGTPGAPQLAATGTLTSTTNSMPASFNVAYPTGTQANDVAIIFVHGHGAVSALTIDTPTGWTQIQQTQVAITNVAIAAFWKRLSGGESGSVAMTASGGTGSSTGTSVQACMTLWRGCLSSGTPVESSGTAVQSTASAVPGAPTRTIASQDRTLIHCYGFVEGSTPTFTQGSEYSLAWQGGNATAAQSYRSLTVPISVAETATASSSSRWGCIYFSLIPQTTVSSSTPYANDAFWNYVKLLCGFETAIADESSVARTLTAAGNAQRSSAWSDFGSFSALFDGTGDYITAADSADWDVGRQPFTIEMAVKLSTKQSTQAFIGQWDNAGTFTNDAFFLFITGGNLTFRIASGSSTFDCVFAWVPTLGTKYRLAVDRDITGKTRLYIDGTMVASATNQNLAPNNSTNVFSIGRIGGSGTSAGQATFDYNGNMDEIRLTKGIARYNSDGGFAPPSAAYPRS